MLRIVNKVGLRYAVKQKIPTISDRDLIALVCYFRFKLWSLTFQLKPIFRKAF